MTGRPPQVGWLRRLAGALRPHRRVVAAALGAAGVGQVVAALTPLVERHVIDRSIVGGAGGVAPWVVVLLAAGVVRFASAFGRRYWAGRVSLDVQYDLRTAVYDRLQRLDLARHDELRTGQLVSRAGSDIGLIQGLLAFLPIVAANVLFFVIALVVMTWLNPLLTLVAVAVTPLLAVLSVRLRRTQFPATWDAQQQAGVVAGVVEEAVSGVRVVKGFGQEARELDRLAAAAGGLLARRVRAIRLQARYQPALAAVPALGQVAVLALGGWLAIRGRISLGTFLAFSSYVTQLQAPVRMLTGLLTVGQQARAGVERVFDLLDSTPAVVDPDDPVELGPVRGELVFESVTFGYLRSEPVLDGFDLRLAPGETVALVGTSGSGKSTVALLLPRFYDVQRGAVRLDGIDVRQLRLDELRRSIGVVFEDSFLFSDSIRANIAYGRPDATDAEIRAAATAAEADGFIDELADGYDTVVGERGLTLSGGQRQRIALARAILTDPAVLVLDDATSAIDSRVEHEIHETLRRLAADRTTLLVAHRRSTLALADRIAVVEGGRVLDIGTHDELVGRCAAYRRLISGPAGGAEGEAAESDDVAGVDDAVDPMLGITPALWPAAAATDGATPFHAVASTGGWGPGGMVDALAASPELLARVDALPPLSDEADIGVAEASQGDGRFRFVRFLRRWRLPLLGALALVTLDGLASLAGPVLIRHGIDAGVRPRVTGALWVASWALLAVVVVDWLVVTGQTLVAGRTAERILYALRIRVFAHLQRLSLDYYDRELGGRIMTRMTTDVEALTQLLQSGLVTAVVSLLTCVGVAVALAVMDWRLALVAAVVLPPLIAATWWFRRRSAVAYDEARERVGTVNAEFQESLSGVRVAQANASEARNSERFAGLSRAYLASRLRAQRYVATYFPFVEMLSEVAAAVVLAAGAGMVRAGDLSVGALLAFLLYLDLFFSPIQQLSQVFDTYQQASVALDRAEELLATPTGTPEPSAPVHLGGRATGEIELVDVRFRYPSATTDALRGVDLRVSPGETVAIVGETGAGKSTIEKLIARFYDPTAGVVRLDGIDVRELPLAELRHQLGVVPQEAFLFAGTVRDNIAYARPDATDAEVEAAARAVGAHEVVAHLPGGYRAVVGERGQTLSAGQRQLLALARALLVDPPVLLLDEATANLDLATEARVNAAMGVAAAGRTTVLIAHRLPTAAAADRIVVLAAGRVVEEGTHPELLAADGAYAAMWSAFEGEGRPRPTPTDPEL